MLRKWCFLVVTEEKIRILKKDIPSECTKLVHMWGVLNLEFLQWHSISIATTIIGPPSEAEHMLYIRIDVYILGQQIGSSLAIAIINPIYFCIDLPVRTIYTIPCDILWKQIKDKAFVPMEQHWENIAFWQYYHYLNRVKITYTPSSITFYHLHPLIYPTLSLNPLSPNFCPNYGWSASKH